MKCKLIFIAVVVFATYAVAQKSEAISSPDKKIAAQIYLTSTLNIVLKHEGVPILSISGIKLNLSNSTNRYAKGYKEAKSVDFTSKLKVKQLRNYINENYNELMITLSEEQKFIMRVYNNAFAYRFLIQKKNGFQILNESALVNFNNDDTLFYPQMINDPLYDAYNSDFELIYNKMLPKDIVKQKIVPAPFVSKTKKNVAIGIFDADVKKYPGLFIGPSSTPTQITFTYAELPDVTTITGTTYHSITPVTRKPFIAAFNNAAKTPWRVFEIEKEEKNLLVSDMAFKLSAASDTLSNYAWVKPGFVLDNWIIDGVLYGVDFVSGNNTDSYKYYIDYASQYGIQYVMIEPEWSDVHNIDLPVANMNMPELFSYAKSKKVDLLLWTENLALQKNLSVYLKKFQQWGAKGIMVDFFNRDDQETAFIQENIAKECANFKLMVMFHGCGKPAGFERTFPNAITREAVAGSEYNKWTSVNTPAQCVNLPFIRGLGGPFDYEPLIVHNVLVKDHLPNNMNPKTMNTRAAELAKLVLYFSPWQVVSGSIVELKQDEVISNIFKQIPLVWDESIALNGKINEFATIARKNANDWFVAGLNANQNRGFDINLDFLDMATAYKLSIIKDGLNAHKAPQDYVVEEREAKKGDKIHIETLPNGGYLLFLKALK